MKKLEQRVPNLRFKGFTDDWEQHKLGTLFQKNIERNDNEKFNYNQTLSVSTMTFKPTGNGASAKSLANYKVLRLGDVAFEGHSNKQFSYGRFVVNDNADGIMSPRFATIRPIKAININYWKNYLHNENIMKYVLVKSTKAGTMMNELVYSDLYKQVLKVPNITEQVKIGNLLQKIEIIITLQQRKLDLLKQLKKGFLQKMFADKDSKRPILRFEGFNNEWEQRKVLELADRYDNLRVPITASERVAGETPYYGANGIQDYVKGFTHNGEFVLVAEDGANDLQNYPVQYVDGKVWVNNHAHVLQAKEERVDNKFLTNALKHTNIEPYLVGGGRAKLNADVMMKINFKVPTLPEQVQIGKFFDNLDHLIALQHQKLAKYQSVKKSLLQQMFI